MDTTFLINLIGWLGSAAVVAAYALISTHRVTGNSLVYQALNLIGSIFLVINTCYLGALPSAFLNAIWIGIALYALWRIWRKN